MKTSRDIRNEFLDFFKQREHTFVPSASLMPAEDPTLLFTNAGMNQFKDIFLGVSKRDYVRAANSQKCIRAGGKHNDLEDVGHDTCHLTFFEMLGNWSFGDYFKADTIIWAWELLTGVWKLPKDRLYVTVFGGDDADGLEADDEAVRLWQEKTDIDPSHILRFGRKDNFWEPGETGPCGPCSEIHIDLTPDGSGGQLVNADDPRVIELWNLVFIQFNRDQSGKLVPLAARHVDTGMGFERLVMVMQGKRSLYGSDLFVPIIEKIETLTDHRYGASGGDKDRFDVTGEDDIGDVACRVVADHARALAFAIADGIVPSNEGQGYVMRRILRRGARYGRQYLNIDGPFIADLIPTVVELMGDDFGELRTRRQYIIETVRDEEESFGRTLDRGIELFDRQADKLAKAGGKKLSGQVAFDLYATYGFPLDLTQIMAGERGLEVDVAAYEKAMDEHREISGTDGAFKADEIPDLPATDAEGKYSLEAIDATVLGWVIDNEYHTAGRLGSNQAAAVVLDRTNFYGAQGGQVGDRGLLEFAGGKFIVGDTVLAGACVLHVGALEDGQLGVGDKVTARVDPTRLDTMRNHTATHLLNWALRRVLGEHVNQAGSIVGPDRLRFDFSHNKALSAEQLAEVQRLVNGRILDDLQVTATVLPLAEAMRIPGVQAIFGEKYPDPVRVILTGAEDVSKCSLEDTSAEFCGGTHLSRTSQIGLFKIISEESIAKGVRRITALTGRGAVDYIQQIDSAVREASQALRVSPEAIGERIVAMQKEIKQLRKAAKAGGAKSGGAEFRPQTTIPTPQGDILIGLFPSADEEAMRAECDRQRQNGAAAMLVGAEADGKVILVAMVSDALVGAGGLKAGQWVKHAAAIVGGGGGGRDTMARAGGKLPDKLPDALTAATDFARSAVADGD